MCDRLPAPSVGAVITGVRKVVVPVEDQERAKEFWTRVGFEVMQDETYGDERWIEVASPDRGTILVLSPRPVNQPYTELTERGVEFPTPPMQMHFGWWAMFTDRDGTRYALGQWDRR
jgi:hypothetical protein